MLDLAVVFAALRALMAPHVATLDVKTDTSLELYLDTPYRQKNGKPLFFGAVQVKKGFVSYHLMPVYLEPTLLAGLSIALTARMQGKSCFNFKAVDSTLFDELGALTRAAHADFGRRGYLVPRNADLSRSG